jgi:hypothetical protein
VRFGPGDAGALSAAAMPLLAVSRDFGVSIALVDRALMLNLNLGDARSTSGFARLFNGESELAIAHLENAMRLSPFDSVSRAKCLLRIVNSNQCAKSSKSISRRIALPGRGQPGDQSGRGAGVA